MLGIGSGPAIAAKINGPASLQRVDNDARGLLNDFGLELELLKIAHAFPDNVCDRSAMTSVVHILISLFMSANIGPKCLFSKAGALKNCSVELLQVL